MRAGPIGFQIPLWVSKPNVDFETPNSRDLFTSCIWTVFVGKFRIPLWVSKPNVDFETPNSRDLFTSCIWTMFVGKFQIPLYI
jgi:hypothetical protein